MHKEELVIGSNDIDRYYNLKISSIYTYFQEAAMHAVRDIGADSSDLAKKNIDWVIMRMDVEIIRLPKFHDKVTTVTYPGDDMAMLYPRYYELLDENNNILVKGSSIWGLLDNNTRSLSFKRDLVAKQTPEHTEEELKLPEKINMPADLEKVDTRKIYYSDIDLNGHLNNCAYIRLLVDLHDSEFYKTKTPKFIRVNYLRELKEGNVVTIYSKQENNVEHVKVMLNNDDSFYAEIIY